MVYRVLYLLRHAKSSWKDESLDDIDRPLNKRGKKDAPFMASILAQSERKPDYVISSNSKRTKQTLKHMAAWLEERTIVFSKSLYHCSSEALESTIKDIPNNAGSALICGHNPSMEDLLYELGFEGKFPTCAIAKITVKGDWKDFNKESTSIQWVDYPKKHPEEVDP